MSYGTIKVDTITFTDNSVDKSVSLSGLIQNPTFTGNITVTGTISGDVIRGGTTVSGATVTGTTANFVSGVFTTQISGATVTGSTASFTSGVFTNISGTTTTITSGIIASGTAAAPSLAILADLDTGLFSPGANELAVATNGTRRLLIDSAGALTLDTGDATIYGVRVGRGGGAVATNTAVGASALSSNITGAFNTAIGNNALRVNTANVNTAVGDSALYSCTTGYQNVAIGPFALYSDVSGINNIAIGRDALYFNTATGNIAIGTGALKATTSGANNLGIGDQALFSNTEGTLNTVIGGRNTAYDNTTGSNNVVLGDLALRFNTIGSNNTCIGTNAGYDLTTGSNNTIIGNVQGTAGLANTVIIGAGATERLRIDSSGNVGIGTSSPNVPLDIESSSGTAVKIRLASNTSNRALVFSNAAETIGWTVGNGVIASARQFVVYDNEAGAARLLIDSSGRLGIGTTSPQGNLEVSNTASGATIRLTRPSSADLNFTPAQIHLFLLIKEAPANACASTPAAGS
jgi:trimeric autotransporter adhesin